MALATSIMTILPVHYFVSHKPVITPSWGSMLFMVFVGFFTCIVYFQYYLFLPQLKLFRPGSMLAQIFTMKWEFLYHFSMSAIWISGSLAYAADFRGHENCQWDGYYHYPKPSDWNHACDMINWVVPMGYATFGVQVALFSFVLFMLMYMFLFLDQDTINEPFWKWGRRAYEYQHRPPAALASVNQPMQYRPNARGLDEKTMLQPYYGPEIYDEDDGDKFAYKDERPKSVAHSMLDGFSENSSSTLGSSLGRSSRGRRGAAYSDPTLSPDLLDSFDDESSTTTNPSAYYGGAYARHSANSRRAGLSEAPKPAGSGRSSTPAWSAPSITSDGDTISPAPPPMRPAGFERARSLRHASAPVALGSRGRRGAAYASSNSNDSSDSIETPAHGVSKRAQRPMAHPRRRLSADEESGWHLREN